MVAHLSAVTSPSECSEIEPRSAVASSLDVSMHRGAISLVGEIDASTLGIFDSVLTVARPYRNELVIDLAGVTFIDVAGTRLLVHLARQLSPAVRVTVMRPPPHIEMILPACGWEEELEIAADEAIG